VHSRRPSETFLFATAVAGVGMLLRDSEHKGAATYAALLEQARVAKGADRDGYRSEFMRLTEMLALMERKVASGSR
jgi:Ca-activated chloride channel homolog